MNFYLAVWNSPAAVSDDEAGARYSALSDEKPAEPFDGQVYAFYCRLTNLYPEVEMVPDDKLISCPWACALDVAGGYVIMAIRPEQAAEVIGQIVALAAQHELVCFDPQASKVYLPKRLEKEAKAIPADKRAKVHIAGLNNPAFEQRCDRCYCVLVPRGDKSWEPGTTVAYFGHGHWSRLDPHEACRVGRRNFTAGASQNRA